VGATATRLEVELYTPHAAQRQIHESRTRFRIATCGRKFGKTMMGVNELVKYALEHPATFTAWIAPTYGQTEIAFNWMCDEFRDAMAAPPNKTKLLVTWPHTSRTQFFSVDKHNNIRGHGFHFIVGDEFADWSREAWEASVRPTLTATEGGALLIGTPRGRNLFWELWMKGQDRDRYPDYESWQLPSSANPYNTAREIAGAKESLPADVFRQEYEAAFLEDSAGVFRNIAACEHGDFEPWQHPRVYVIGWDPAKHADASVIAVLDAERKHVVHWERILQRDYTVQIARIAALSKQYGNALVLMDSTGVGDPLLEQLGVHGVPAEGYTFTNTTKQQLVEHLAVVIERGEVSWPKAVPVLRHELEAFQYELTRAGNVRYSAPEGQHDDCVMSLGLAVWAARHFAAGAPLAVNLRTDPYEPTTWGEIR
jgi:phage terminase large subunit-like protein